MRALARLSFDALVVEAEAISDSLRSMPAWSMLEARVSGVALGARSLPWGEVLDIKTLIWPLDWIDSDCELESGRICFRAVSSANPDLYQSRVYEVNVYRLTFRRGTVLDVGAEKSNPAQLSSMLNSIVEEQLTSI